MSQQINYTQDDRDRIIRTETAITHMDNKVDALERDTKDLVETSRNQAFAIAGILESMKDAKAFMHEVGQHNQRITILENRVKECEYDRADITTLTNDADSRLNDIEKKLDRMAFLGKVVWGVITTPAILAAVILGLQFVQNPKVSYEAPSQTPLRSAPTHETGQAR